MGRGPNPIGKRRARSSWSRGRQGERGKWRGAVPRHIELNSGAPSAYKWLLNSGDNYSDKTVGMQQDNCTSSCQKLTVGQFETHA